MRSAQLAGLSCGMSFRLTYSIGILEGDAARDERHSRKISRPSKLGATRCGFKGFELGRGMELRRERPAGAPENEIRRH